MNCLTCKHINNLKISYENTGNFTHVIYDECPFLSEDCYSVNFDGSFSKDPILINMEKCEVWVDGGLSTKYCKGHKDHDNTELIKKLLENILRDDNLEYTNLKFSSFKGLGNEYQ